ncbi:MAG TPA: PAS domain S-box protein [Candidatus Binatia bacterium]
MKAQRNAEEILFAVGVTAFAVLLRWLIDPWLGSDLPYSTVFGAVAFAVYFGGIRGGLLSAVLGFAACSYLFFAQRGAVRVATPGQVVGLAIFVATNAVIIGLGHAMRSARRRAQHEGDRTRTILASIGDAVIVTDAEGRITFLNGVAEELSGWRSAEAVGRPHVEVFRILHEHTRREVEDPVARALHEGKPIGLANHTLLVRKDGSECPVDDSAAPIRDHEGSIFGVILVFRDVTEQRRVQYDRERLATIVRDSGDAFITKDLDGIIQTWNVSAEALFGYTAEEIVGRSVATLVPAGRLDEEARILASLRNGQPIERVETERMTSDGRLIPVAVSVSPLRNAEGELIGASKILHDITERIAARRDLEREKELLATTLASIGDGVMTTDRRGRVMSINAVAEQLTGWTAQDAVGRSLDEVFRIVNEQTRRTVESPAARALREGVIVGLANHTILIRKDAREIPIDDSAAPIRLPEDPLAGCVLVFRDVTERRRSEREIADSRASLQLADRRKNEFLATLAHELRNPLAPMRNSLQILRMTTADDETTDRAIGTMERQVEQMVHLVDDLLDVARISRGKIELRNERVELGAIVQQAMEICRPLAECLHHEVHVSLPDEPVYLQADRVRLAQVLSNLINNACKYTQPGGRIDLVAERRGGTVEVRVKDTGVGIPAEMLETVFEMFAQVDRSLERSQGGLGIGLTLAKELVEMHSGTIQATSAGPGLGTEVAVRLPVLDRGAEDAARPASNDHERGEARRVLVVDDNVDSADSLSMLLRMRGHQTKIARDGVEAVEAARTFRPEIVLLDIGLPRMNGLDVCRRIRAQEWGSAMRIVALTGWGQEEDRLRSLEAGFDHHLVKPVNIAELTTLIAQLPPNDSDRQ